MTATFNMKRNWADGTQAIVLEPFDFIARLCALVPPPYFNLTRFHGVFAPNAKLRAQVVPDNRAAASEPRQLELFTSDITTTLLHGQPANDASSGKPARHPLGAQRNNRHSFRPTRRVVAGLLPIGIPPLRGFALRGLWTGGPIRS